MASRRTNAYVGVGLNERFIDDGYEDKHLHGITDAHATATVISIMGSIGVFNLPYALNAGGWLGLPLILLCGAMSLYTARLLVSCLHSGDDGKRIASYAALGEVAFGSSGRVVVLYFQYATLLGMAVARRATASSHSSATCWTLAALPRRQCRSRSRHGWTASRARSTDGTS